MLLKQHKYLQNANKGENIVKIAELLQKATGNTVAKNEGFMKASEFFQKAS